jgi:hypothetical protein
MSAVDNLMQTAVADVELLRLLDSQGDRFGAFRDVEFLLRAPSDEQAELAASFVNDHSYGRATVQAGEQPAVLIVIHMPIEQHIVMSVSGFMACLSRIFGLEYDGWGCVAQAERP